MRHFNADAEIQGLLRELQTRGEGRKHAGFTKENAQALKAEKFELQVMRDLGYGYERLDQLTMEVLLGVR